MIVVVLNSITVLSGTNGREFMGRWREVVSELDPEHREMLEGGALSKLFLSYSLTACHPVIIGSIYGVLASITLILPFSYSGWIEGSNFNEVFNEWGIISVILITLCAALGGLSNIVSMIVKRPPLRLENKRRFIFPFPFIGLFLITCSMLTEVQEVVTQIGWLCAILPGPIYVHLSYAPRWRILDRIDRDLSPFEGMKRTIDNTIDNDSDQDLEEILSEI